MSKRSWPVKIWFLDNDLAASASFLTDKTLIYSIKNCISAVVSTYFYFIGIRKKKFYEHFFSDENIERTMSRFFSTWPFGNPPVFSAYNSKESKWCRSCHENFDYVVRYLELLFDEYAFRHGEQHENYAFLEWAKHAMDNVVFPYAKLKDIILPWKCIDPQFRTIDIIGGYRKQFMSSFTSADPLVEYAKCHRDIPRFVVEHFHIGS